MIPTSWHWWWLRQTRKRTDLDIVHVIRGVVVVGDVEVVYVVVIVTAIFYMKSLDQTSFHLTYCYYYCCCCCCWRC